MLDILKATLIVEDELPKGKIQKHIEYERLYVFQVYLEGEGEEEFDPFYSVNKFTGEFRDFSILNGDTPRIIDLFSRAVNT